MEPIKIEITIAQHELRAAASDAAERALAEGGGRAMLDRLFAEHIPKLIEKELAATLNDREDGFGLNVYRQAAVLPRAVRSAIESQVQGAAYKMVHDDPAVEAAARALVAEALERVMSKDRAGAVERMAQAIEGAMLRARFGGDE